MPRGDGTGPQGFGAMTGGGRGYCVGVNNGGYLAPARRGFVQGRGRGFCQGGGRGFGGYRNMNYAGYNPYVSYTAQNEAEFLKNQVKSLEGELEIAKERLKGVEVSDK